MDTKLADRPPQQVKMEAWLTASNVSGRPWLILVLCAYACVFECTGQGELSGFQMLFSEETIVSNVYCGFMYVESDPAYPNHNFKVILSLKKKKIF